MFLTRDFWCSWDTGTLGQDCTKSQLCLVAHSDRAQSMPGHTWVPC